MSCMERQMEPVGELSFDANQCYSTSSSSGNNTPPAPGALTATVY